MRHRNTADHLPVVSDDDEFDQAVFLHSLQVPADDALVATVVWQKRRLCVAVGVTASSESDRCARLKPTLDHVVELTNQLLVQVNHSGPHTEFLLVVVGTIESKLATFHSSCAISLQRKSPRCDSLGVWLIRNDELTSRGHSKEHENELLANCACLHRHNSS